MSSTTLSLPKPAWLVSPRWDLFFLIGSALLVPLPLLIKNGFGFSVTLVNLAVTILIGGPHLFATFTYTLMEKSFWARYKYYALGSFVIPPLVILAGLKAFSLLLGVFFFWASIHILHQICYLTDCYREKQGRMESPWSKAIDYAIVFTSIYPIAFYKMVKGEFFVAGKNLIIPLIHGSPIVFVMALSLFIVSLVLFTGKSIVEYRQGKLNFPKTLLISVTAFVSFLLPIPKDLDVTFQGFNTWHSLQYFALAWWMNSLRKERQDISSPFVQKISGPKKTPLFYLACLVPTLIFLGVVSLIFKLSGIPYNQCYFMVVLSGLLMHYYFDHWVFTQTQAVVP